MLACWRDDHGVRVTEVERRLDGAMLAASQSNMLSQDANLLLVRCSTRRSRINARRTSAEIVHVPSRRLRGQLWQMLRQT